MSSREEKNKKICVIDFDGTLIRTDSLFTILLREKLFFDPGIFFWGSMLFFIKRVVPRGRQATIRRRLKFSILKAIHIRGEERIIATYGPLLSRRINVDLLRHVIQSYQAIYIISASWQPLIQSILAGVQESSLRVFGTEYKEVFSEFKNCWHTDKAEILKEYHIDTFDVYTDSYDDYCMMQKAQRIFLVDKKGIWKQLER